MYVPGNQVKLLFPSFCPNHMRLIFVAASSSYALSPFGVLHLLGTMRTRMQGSPE